MTERYPLHCMFYSDAGGGKSRLAATFPKPMYVAMFDPKSKVIPYVKRGVVVEKLQDDVERWVINSKKDDRMIITIDFFQDFNIKAGRSATYAWEKFEAHLDELALEVAEGIWETVVIDSLSFLEYAVRKYDQYKKNPVTKKGNEQDTRQHYNRSAEEIEELCYSRVTWYNCNVCVLAHVRDKEDRRRGELIYVPEAPGVKGRKLPSAFGEVYYLGRSADGVRYLQTEEGDKFMATTQIPAPNGCEPHYDRLWDNADKEE